MDRRLFQSLVVAASLGIFGAAYADEVIIVQSTTSTANSGLYDHLLPIVQKATGVEARVVAVGSGHAISNASNCDGDVLLVHAKAAEQEFVAAGYGVARYDLMYNDFVIVGPELDPAGIAGVTTAVNAFSLIAQTQTIFVSRGDDSGTHRAEQAIWSLGNVDPTANQSGWYRQTGSGMGAALNIAVGMEGYLLVDRATWASSANKGNLTILLQGDQQLLNQYGIVAVNPLRCPSVNVAATQRFVDYLLSAEGQSAIAAFKPKGEQLFFPNAKR